MEQLKYEDPEDYENFEEVYSEVPPQRKSYIESFFSGIDWDSISILSRDFSSWHGYVVQVLVDLGADLTDEGKEELGRGEPGRLIERDLRKTFADVGSSDLMGELEDIYDAPGRTEEDEERLGDLLKFLDEIYPDEIVQETGGTGESYYRFKLWKENLKSLGKRVLEE